MITLEVIAVPWEGAGFEGSSAPLFSCVSGIQNGGVLDLRWVVLSQLELCPVEDAVVLAVTIS